MGDVTLEEAVYRLTHERSFREAFLADRFDELGLSGDTLRELELVDRVQLCAFAERVREDVLRRRHRGTGGLLDNFPRTVAAWRAEHPDDPALHELIDRFLESPPYRAHRDVGTVGCCIEEAFFEFCETQDIGSAQIREDELLTTLLRTLAVCPDPGFTVPAMIFRRGAAWVAVSRCTPEPVLYTASADRFARGVVTAFIAAVVRDRDALNEPNALASLARAHKVEGAVADGVARHLSRLGLAGSGAL